MTAIKVLLAEDSVLLREGLVRLLGEAGYDVVGAVGDAEELLRAVTELTPELVVTDVRMPPGHSDEGLRAALKIRSLAPLTGILVLSQYCGAKLCTGFVGYCRPGRRRGLPAQRSGYRC
ncbi:two-component response regulator [Renibacterium salmoninarum ATCC 33209]|uniref:Two-component response regulator n=1 Tax=Renibacterium salmoninarum (strain ATCC 33209 / DSM 20767 / JCM 11484 / NBRC 15589 / NCIMB 2235) TaxID=288705 RepID=A9WTE0_RENSM|nr:two-component response regulator [Renibacterium salmoninarum ATCC 33209]